MAALKDRIADPEFLARHRERDTAFVRDRILTFERIIFFLLNLIKSSLQAELDSFFEILYKNEFTERIVTKSAFSIARKKFKASAFVELNTCLVSNVYRLFQPKRWHGFDLRAVDGSTLRLPDTEDVIATFGREFPENGRPYTMGRISHLFDPLNQMIIDAVIAPYRDDERSLLVKHLDAVRPGDLLLLDAGYPAFWLFAELLRRKINWCARASLKSWSVISDFVASGRSEAIVMLPAPRGDALRECRDRGLPCDPIRVRLVRVPLPDGTIEVLITSLLDVEEYPHEEFQELYHLRWQQEENYKFLKCRAEIANWSGKSALSVYQDFHARIVTANLTMSLVATSQEIVDVDNKNADTTLPKQVNKTQALSRMKNAVVRLLTHPDPLARLRSLVVLFSQTVESVRPGRSFERRKDIKPRVHYQAYKSCL